MFLSHLSGGESFRARGVKKGSKFRSKILAEILIKFGSGVKVGNKIPTFYGQDRWKTFVYEQKGLEIVKKPDFGVKN